MSHVITATTRPTYTADAIRAMDGPALTRVAWEMGLDPRDLVGRRYFCWECRSWGEAPIDASGTIWRPHERVDQADAVFRQLRQRGWATVAKWWPMRGLLSGGCAEAMSLTGGGLYTVEYATQAEEALALLRCSVLAMASMMP